MSKYLLPFLLIFLTEISFCQSNKNPDFFHKILDDAEIFFVDGYSFYTYPLRMKGREWLTAAGIGLGTYGFVHSDKYIRNRIGLDINEYKNNFWIIFEKYGVIQYAEAVGAATYLYGLFSKDDDSRILGRMIVQSLTYSGLTTMFLRMIAGRVRPPFTEDHLNYQGFESDNKFQSFPSGHVTVAFALSTVLAEYFDTPLSRITFYSFAGLASIERLINTQHWFSDIFLGALVGAAGAVHVLSEESKRNSDEGSRLSIQPTMNGISLRYSLN